MSFRIHFNEEGINSVSCLTAMISGGLVISDQRILLTNVTKFQDWSYLENRDVEYTIYEGWNKTSYQWF